MGAEEGERGEGEVGQKERGWAGGGEETGRAIFIVDRTLKRLLCP